LYTKKRTANSASEWQTEQFADPVLSQRAAVTKNIIAAGISAIGGKKKSFTPRSSFGASGLTQRITNLIMNAKGFVIGKKHTDGG